MKLAIFYHGAFSFGDPPGLRENAIEVVHEQMEHLRVSGLLCAADEFVVGLNGDGESQQIANLVIPAEAKVVLHGPQCKNECRTILALEEWLSAPDWYVLYFHAKGSSHPADHERSTKWRGCMMRNLVQNWERCVADLDSGYEAVGCHWLEPPNAPPTHHIFAGNFWWAKSSFLLTLPSIMKREQIKRSGIDSLDSRFEAEVWLGNGPRTPYVKDYHPANPMDGTCRGLETKKATVKKIAVVYIYPLDGKDEHGTLARNFVQSYHRHPPGFDHDTVIVCNGAPVTQNAKALFSSLPNCTFLEHDDSGWDIGGYQKAARTVPCDLMVFFGGSTLLRRAGWLKRMVEAYEKHGEGLYGVMANTGDVNGRHGRVVYPHIRTTGFWTSPALMNCYPTRIVRDSQRYEFEHGVTCLSEWVRKQGLPLMMVTWDGEYKKDWHLIENGLHRGDQSALLAWDRLNSPPYYPK